jgi:hypothetical protein
MNDRRGNIPKQVSLSATQHQNGKPSATVVGKGRESDRVDRTEGVYFSLGFGKPFRYLLLLASIQS